MVLDALQTTTTSTTPSTTTMEMDAPAPAPASAPALLLDCLLCDLSFNTAEEKRQHAKSEWQYVFKFSLVSVSALTFNSVYKIRCRVAEPGTIVTPPDSDPKSSAGVKKDDKSPRQDGMSSWESSHIDEESYDEESASDSSYDKEVTEFIAGECLFCNHTSEDFDDNLSHMHQTHSLVVPFQSSLAVDLQTLIWYLHMVIFTYRECICCGKRRRTVEAVQQHMTSTGHCRFDVTGEMSEFYDMDSLAQQTTENRSHPDDRTLKLPSGKLLAHRSYVDSTSKRRTAEKSPDDSTGLPSSQQSAGSKSLTRRDRKEQALVSQFTQLRMGDQMSLMHLPESQQRPLLLAYKKELSEAKRAERRNRRRLDNVGNKTAIHANNYKQEVPVYTGG